VSADSNADAWAVGSFDLSNALQQPLAEHWNGKAWSVVTAARYETGANELSGVAALNPADAWAVGSYDNIAEKSPQPLIEHWNGNNWSVVRSPLVGGAYGGQLEAVSAVSSTDAWAVGWSYTSSTQRPPASSLGLIEHWNGASWSVVPSPSHGSVETNLTGIAVVDANDIWVSGVYAPTQQGLDYTFAEHWNGKTWTLAATPIAVANYVNRLNGIAAVSTGSVFAAGYAFSPAYGHYRNLSEHWNGSAWSSLPAPNASYYDTELSGIAAVSAAEVLSVGTYKIYGTTPEASHTFAMVWNGKNWGELATPNLAVPGTFFEAVSRIPGTADAWAAGGILDANQTYAETLIERYHC
jgi:hypothetical protein